MNIDQQRKIMLDLSKQVHEHYEREKATWAFNHPEATPQAYNAAMRAIAERLGL